jgi:hypothetical protein
MKIENLANMVLSFLSICIHVFAGKKDRAQEKVFFEQFLFLHVIKMFNCEKREKKRQAEADKETS